MRVPLTATMAASVLAIGLSLQTAHALPPGSGASLDAAAAVLQVQQKDMSPGAGQGQGGGHGQGGGPSMGTPRPNMGVPGGGGMRSEGQHFRSGQQGTYGYGPSTGESRGGPRGELRGERGGPRMGRQYGEEYGRGPARRHFGERGWEGGRVYGYRTPDCGWLRHRALVTGSPYWWHQYRVCLR